MDSLIRIRIRIGLVVGLINARSHEREEYHRVLKCVNGNARSLPGNRSNSVNEDRLRVTIEKDIESGRGVCTMMDDKNGGIMEYEMDSGRVSRRVCISERERKEKVGFVAITLTIKLYSTDSGDLFFASIGQEYESRVWNG